MRRLLMAAMVALIASPAVADPGAWQVQDKVSVLDGTHEFIAYVNADTPVADIIGNDKKPILTVTCTQGQSVFSLSIMWPDFIDKDDDDDHFATFTWKLDDGSPQKSQWEAADRSVFQIGADGMSWSQRWSAGKVLIVRVPDKHGGQEATFQIAGLDQIVAQINQMKCG